MTKFRIAVPFRDRATGAVREIVVQLSRAETLDSMAEARRRGMDPVKDGFRPVEVRYATNRACLSLGGEWVWSEPLEAWAITYPLGLEPVFSDVRRAPELRVA